MSDILINVGESKIIIEKTSKRKELQNKFEINYNKLILDKKNNTKIKVTKNTNQNKIIYICNIDEDKSLLKGKCEIYKFDYKKKINLGNVNQTNCLVIYSDYKNIYYYFGIKASIIKMLIKLEYKLKNIKFNKNKLSFKISANIINKYGINIESQHIGFDFETRKEINFDISKKSNINLKEKWLNYTQKMKNLINYEYEYNSKLRFYINSEGEEFFYMLGRKENYRRIKFHYVPLKSGVKIKNTAIHLRRTPVGTLVLVRRPVEDVEKNIKFKIFESAFLSFVLFFIGKLARKVRKKKINLFYEKFASKSEEGTFDLCELVSKRTNNNSYFIIDKNSNDYEKIKASKLVIKKYSLKYYWNIYTANTFISTESPSHLNIIRSNNKWMRRTLMEKKFIFLQHGITYLKRQGDMSTFAKDKEGEVDYIVVGSEKEKEICVDMLGIKENQCLKTGLPIFDTIEYNHIDEKCQDIVTIMLTWKPYEESITDFKKSSYYKNNMDVIKALSGKIKDKNIIVIPHPKMINFFNDTDIKKYVKDMAISEILKRTKLLITDYSSVCYNSFYQGGAVIFYQPDIDIFEKEVGKLIPYDNEYIGERCFNYEQLNILLKKCISNFKIKLNLLRNENYMRNYKAINKFSDGKNTERLIEKLDQLNII